MLLPLPVLAALLCLIPGTDIYADYDLRPLVDYYTGYVKSSSLATALMERKYDRLAIVYHTCLTNGVQFIGSVFSLTDFLCKEKGKNPVP